jgi:hypothetical protein
MSLAKTSRKLDVLPLLSYPYCPLQLAVPAVLSQMFCHGCLSQHSCPPALLSLLSYPFYRVLNVLFISPAQLPYPGSLSYLSCPCCHILAVMPFLSVLSDLFRLTLQANLSQLSSPYYPALAVMFAVPREPNDRAGWVNK